MESEMVETEFKSDPVVQKCVVLQDKLAGLKDNLQATPKAPPPEKRFVQREALMARANSLKKAISSVIDVTEKGKGLCMTVLYVYHVMVMYICTALDSHVEDMDEIRQLTSEIDSNFKSRTRLRQPKDSVSSISSVVDPVP